MDGIALYPKVEVLANGIMFALRPLPVCQSVQCADKEAPLTLEALVFGQFAWTFEWGIQHGVGTCARCGAWHQIYHFTPATWWQADCVSCEYTGPQRQSDQEAREDRDWHRDNTGHAWVNVNTDRVREVYAQIVDSRPEHYEDGKVPDDEGATV